MRHVDEGTLHAYLDGELAALGAAEPELEAHLASCPDCRARLGEARRTHGRAAEILGAAVPELLTIPPFAEVVARAAAGADTHPEGRTTMDDTAAVAPAPAPVKPRFRNLVASGGTRRRSWSSRTVAASLLAHAVIIAGAVYASVHMPAAVKKAQELVTYVEVKEKPPEPPKPAEPPPPPPPEAPKPATPPPPKGFQELMPPKTPPPAIPDINPSAPPVNPEDFTGIGQAGGTHNGVEGGVPQTTPADSNFVYQSQQLDAAPSITNASQVRSALSRMYPRMLQDAGISGTTVLEFTVEKDGTVDEGTVKVISTTNEQFSDPARRVAAKMRFTPPMYRGHPVRTLVQMPIQWKPES